MIYGLLTDEQKIFLKDNCNIVIEDREYSQKEIDNLEDIVANYMQTHSTFDPYPDPVWLMCESILDIINE